MGLIGLLEPQTRQDCLYLPDGPSSEALFPLLNEQVEPLARDAVFAAPMAFGLVPEALDFVDMVALIGTQLEIGSPRPVDQALNSVWSELGWGFPVLSRRPHRTW
jgi:hypothetical protein